MTANLARSIRDLRDLEIRRHLFANPLEFAVFFQCLYPVAQIVVSQGSSPMRFRSPSY